MDETRKPTLRAVSEIPGEGRPNHRKGRGKSVPDWNKVPEWAQTLIVTVCQDQGFDVPPVRWTEARASRGEPRSTGTTHWSTKTETHTQITIRAGIWKADQELVVLHELAHWLSPITEYHGRRFWNLAFDLYERYATDFDMAYAAQREWGYRGMAKTVIRERGYVPELGELVVPMDA